MPSPDFKGIFVKALEKNVDNPKWKEGDFVGIKTVSNTKVGSIGQDFIEGLCTSLSLACAFPTHFCLYFKRSINILTFAMLTQYHFLTSEKPLHRNLIPRDLPGSNSGASVKAEEALQPTAVLPRGLLRQIPGASRGFLCPETAWYERTRLTP